MPASTFARPVSHFSPSPGNRAREERKLTLEKEGCLVGNQVTSQVLGCVHQTGDESSPQIGTLHQVEEGRFTPHLALDLDSPLNHSHGLFSLRRVLIAEALDRSKSLVPAATTNEPPWGFGAEEDKDQEGRLL
jgi:hypothetical protein